ncbi:antirestriction protein ArdA [Vagococcus fluvialis]|uniref:antirestriction protein ArdA n=1 Tax=Vagococcus fluvialis TaxID=2738 RepID=UPI003D14A355
MAKMITEEMMIKADGQRIGGDSDYWVYLTNLKAYNEGVLLGAYLHFPFDRDDLNQAFNQIYVGSEFIDEFGSPYEEYFISDYDAPFSIEEYENILSLIEKFEEIEEYLEYPRELVKIIVENLNQEFIIHNLYDGSTVEEKLGYALCDGEFIIIPDNLINYIDYEAIGRDYKYNSFGEFVDGKYYIEFI